MLRRKERSFSFEFSLNVFTEFTELNSVTKNNIILKKDCWDRTHYLLCERQRLYHSATETQLTENTVKLILIHASVDSLNSIPFRGNPIGFHRNLGHTCGVITVAESY